MPEEWRPIPGWEGWYSVSSEGRVRSERRSVPYPDGGFRVFRQRVLSLRRNTSGYPHVVLCRPGEQRAVQVHALVLLAFVGSRPEGCPEIRHLDGSRTNNSAANLAYGTRSENQLDSVRQGTHRNAKLEACRKGHLFDPENTYVTPDGRRQCAVCRRERASRRRAA